MPSAMWYVQPFGGTILSRNAHFRLNIISAWYLSKIDPSFTIWSLNSFPWCRHTLQSRRCSWSGSLLHGSQHGIPLTINTTKSAFGVYEYTYLYCNRWVSINWNEWVYAQIRRDVSWCSKLPMALKITKISMKARCTTVCSLFFELLSECLFRRRIKWLSIACLHSSSSLSCQQQGNWNFFRKKNQFLR